MGPEAFGSLAAVGVAVQGHQPGQGEGGQEGRDQEADDALAEDHDVFADEGFAVQDQGDRGLEVRQEHRVLRGQAGRHRQEFVGGGEEGRFVGVKREDQGPLPMGGDVPAQLRHPAHRGIAVFQGEGQGARQRRDAGVGRQVPGGLAPVNQEFGARADGGQDGTDQHLAGARRGQGLLPKADFPGAGEIKGLPAHEGSQRYFIGGKARDQIPPFP